MSFHGRPAVLNGAGDVTVEAVAVLAGLRRIDQVTILVHLSFVVALRRRSGGHRGGHDEARRWFNRRRKFLVVFAIVFDWAADSGLIYWPASSHAQRALLHHASGPVPDAITQLARILWVD